MGCHIMKTTIEIADDLFERVQRVARQEKTTFRSLTEQGLRIVLKEKQAKSVKWKWQPVTFRSGGGLTDEFKNASWETIRDEIYRGHGS
jgi:predicted transcriptional regulator